MLLRNHNHIQLIAQSQEYREHFRTAQYVLMIERSFRCT